MNRAQGNFGAVARLLMTVYSAALSLAVGLSSPLWLRELRAGGRYREGWRERLGRIPARLRKSNAGERVIWVHAVSVGEVLAAAPLIARLRNDIASARVLVSTTTRTGQAIARERFGANSVFYFPLDFAFAVRSWIRFLRPSLLVLVESEFWPRMLIEAALAGVPVAVVNARVSPRSWPRYRRLRRLWRPLLATLAMTHAQSADDAERLRFLGASCAFAAGNLKYDVRPPNATPLLVQLRGALLEGAPVLVCGSTLEDEEACLLDVLPSEAILLLAPRHPQRFDAVADLLAQRSRPWVRLSVWRLQPAPIVPGTVLLLDSVGELASLYVLATVAIVGGGFLHEGGHNPLEPAAVARPIVTGRRCANFAGIVQKLEDARAILLADLPEVRRQVERLLTDPEEAAAMGARAELVCRMQAGATERAFRAIQKLVNA